MEKQIKISVIIITRNRAKELERNLNILKNIKGNFEVIVFDNASTDDTEQLIKNKFPHVKYIKSKSNVGPSKGRNIAVKMAQGEYLFFLMTMRF